ncbi:MAG TPA: MerR family transcriptional regulator [Gaiellaceae bacterium]|jgi:MerR family redox-sensitive transcriptional activator SoxR|nr:MerR family transcriptional regulator [Gaiellaceae bacterium]
MSSELLAIGDVARLSGKAPSAIRYYESVGLLAEPVRVSGRRRYPAEVVQSLAVIETGQRAGLTLDDIRLLLRTSADDAGSVEQLRAVAERRLPVLREAIARAEVVREWLEQAADCCCPTLETCPLFEQPSALPERGVSLR